MPLHYDATLKELAQTGPADFLAEFDTRPDRPVQLLNVDLSTVTTAADVVIGIGDPVDEIVHIDAQTGPSGDLHRNVLAYNALLHRRYAVPVHSIVLLLRSQAQHSNLTGSLSYQARPGRGKMDFGFEVVRLWERSAESLLSSGLATLPLAVLGQLPETSETAAALGDVIADVVDRVQANASPEDARRLFTATFVLTGLRASRELTRNLFQGVKDMRDSDTFQMILDEGRDEGRVEGRIEALREVILRLGTKRFGDPDEAMQAEVAALNDVTFLEQLSDRVLETESWQELLG